ncbi:MAG: FAD binding domain-containing protein [Deltaproteobacteria bacterium]|nr:FAD binding domain-containing protein [Deltaproteobacteria bacterium]
MAPRTSDELLSMLGEYRENAKVLAGGTDLLVSMKQRITIPEYLINLKTVGVLDYVTNANGGDGIQIGSLTSLNTIESSPLIREHFPVLAEAAGMVASPHIRQMATIGGNICLNTRCGFYNQSHAWRKSREACLKLGGDVCHVVRSARRCYALFSADTVPALMVLGAGVKVAGIGEEKIRKIEDLYTGDGKDFLSLIPEEIVTEVHIPPLPQNTGSAYVKHRVRGAIDFALIGAAAVITMEDQSVCKLAQVAICGATSAPLRAMEAERILTGEELDEKRIEAAADQASKHVKTISNGGRPISVRYKNLLVRALIKKAVMAAWKRAGWGDA